MNPSRRCLIVPPLSPHEKLRRQLSRLYTTGGDPYNTADSIRLSQQLALDFVEWVRSPQAGPVENSPRLEGALLRRQAE